MTDSDKEAGAAPQAQRPAGQGLNDEAPGDAAVPEAVQEQALRERIVAGMSRRRAPGAPGVRWVPAAQLLSDTAAHLAGHGVTLTEALHRSPRTLLAASAQRSARAARLRAADAPDGPDHPRQEPGLQL